MVYRLTAADEFGNPLGGGVQRAGTPPLVHLTDADGNSADFASLIEEGTFVETGQEVFLARNYGVLVPDSQTTFNVEANTVTLQDALTAAKNAGGGPVMCRRGAFTIRRSLVFGSKVTLQGAGMGATTITKRPTVKSPLAANVATGATTCTVQDGTLFAVGDPIHIYDTSNWEWNSTQARITAINGNVLTFVDETDSPTTPGADAVYQTTRSGTVTTSFPMIRNEVAATRICVRDLTLDHAKNANDPLPTSLTIGAQTDFTLATIHWTEAYYCLVENVELLNASGDAYSDQGNHATESTNPTVIKRTANSIRGCRIRNAGRHGIHWGTSMEGARAIGNEITDCTTGYGVFYCAYATSSTAVGNQLTNCGYGFAGGDDRDYGNVITGNIVKSPVLWAIEFSGGGLGLTTSMSLQVSGNMLHLGTGGKGILIGVADANVGPNTITSETTTVDFIQVTATGDRAYVHDNTITQTTAASGGAGILLNGPDDVRVEGGSIRGVQNGVQFQGALRATVSGVTITGTTARDYWFNGAVSTDCRITDSNGTRAANVTEDTAPVRLVYNNLGTNGTADPASGGSWNSITGARWNGTMVRWNSGGGEKVSVFFQGVGWTVLN